MDEGLDEDSLELLSSVNVEVDPRREIVGVAKTSSTPESMGRKEGEPGGVSKTFSRSRRKVGVVMDDEANECRCR